mmetsp:Transcript_3873/g.9148  ORF Transcript_3873/g.9148 Transcript_3873/m.9148 type:complete len:428 (+) Transcript_3873:342-1625(+)
MQAEVATTGAMLLDHRFASSDNIVSVAANNRGSLEEPLHFFAGHGARHMVDGVLLVDAGSRLRSRLDLRFDASRVLLRWPRPGFLNHRLRLHDAGRRLWKEHGRHVPDQVSVFGYELASLLCRDDDFLHCLVHFLLCRIRAQEVVALQEALYGLLLGLGNVAVAKHVIQLIEEPCPELVPISSSVSRPRLAHIYAVNLFFAELEELFQLLPPSLVAVGHNFHDLGLMPQLVSELDPLLHVLRSCGVPIHLGHKVFAHSKLVDPIVALTHGVRHRVLLSKQQGNVRLALVSKLSPELQFCREFGGLERFGNDFVGPLHELVQGLPDGLVQCLFVDFRLYVFHHLLPLSLAVLQLVFSFSRLNFLTVQNLSLSPHPLHRSLGNLETESGFAQHAAHYDGGAGGRSPLVHVLSRPRLHHTRYLQWWESGQ